MQPLPDTHLAQAVQHLDGYSPTSFTDDQWDRLREPTIALCGLVEWPNRAICRSTARFVAGLLLFTEQSGHGLDPWTALRPQVLEAYCDHGMGDVARSTRSSIRAHLRRLGRAALPTQWPDLRRSPSHADRQPPPYSDFEVAELLRFCDALPSVVFRRRGLAVVLLSAGAGLARQDLGHVHAHGIARADDGGVDVTVGGDRPRVVPVLDRYADQLVAVAAETGDDWLTAVASAKNTVNQATNIRKRLLTAGCPIELSVTRLRLTWVFHHVVARTPLDVLMEAAGVTTIGFIQAAMEHHPATDADVARAALRGNR